jgi:hypothetical protein
VGFKDDVPLVKQIQTIGVLRLFAPVVDRFLVLKALRVSLNLRRALEDAAWTHVLLVLDYAPIVVVVVGRERDAHLSFR